MDNLEYNLRQRIVMLEGVIGTGTVNLFPSIQGADFESVVQALVQ